MTQKRWLGCFLSLLSLGCSGASSAGPPEQGRQPDEGAIWPGLDMYEPGPSSKDNPWVSGGLRPAEDEGGEAIESETPATKEEGQGGGTGSEQDQQGSSGAVGDSRPGSPDSERGSGGVQGTPDETTGAATWPQLILQEYKEGTGSDKRLVFLNVGMGKEGMCSLLVYANGALEPWRKVELLPLPDRGSTIVLCTSTELSADCTAGLSGSPFNGNDALEVICDGAVTDSFGQVGVDPGLSWVDPSDPSLSSKDAWLVRCTEAGDVASNDQFFIEEQWVVVGADEKAEQARLRCRNHLGWGGSPP